MSMRMPNGYGAIVKLSGKRRKPYAVRITTGYRLARTEDAPRAVQVYRYLEYFEKRADAMKYLANYNSGMRVKEHKSLEEYPTFAEIFQTVMQERRDSRKGMTKSLDSAYTAATQSRITTRFFSPVKPRILRFI